MGGKEIAKELNSSQEYFTPTGSARHFAKYGDVAQETLRRILDRCGLQGLPTDVFLQTLPAFKETIERHRMQLPPLQRAQRGLLQLLSERERSMDASAPQLEIIGGRHRGLGEPFEEGIRRFRVGESIKLRARLARPSYLIILATATSSTQGEVIRALTPSLVYPHALITESVVTISGEAAEDDLVRTTWANGIPFGSSTDGRIYCLQLDSGAVRRELRVPEEGDKDGRNGLFGWTLRVNRNEVRTWCPALEPADCDALSETVSCEPANSISIFSIPYSVS